VHHRHSIPRLCRCAARVSGPCFFEVFATVVIAFVLGRLGLIEAKSGATASLLSTGIYLSGEILGTLHHLYFSGTPTVVTAVGAVFSALEVVPLVFIGVEAWRTIRLLGASSWARQWSFWLMNVGLAPMIVLSLLPVGLLQTRVGRGRLLVRAQLR